MRDVAMEMHVEQAKYEMQEGVRIISSSTSSVTQVQVRFSSIN